ncbi:MAG: secondary thiamine-phosphate synthase enzyme YjbQ [Candidatus Kapabacteria bacterium]|nr:secondary thiamine-phosphate synthase enzyme YjbQ [Candidatus Kapabacteria bacterium]
MKVFQYKINLPAKRRGYHLITDEILAKCENLKEIKTGIANIFIQHTSAALSINENADPSVRVDFDRFFDDLVPEDYNKYTHTFEGRDDITAHLKTSIFGNSLVIPITDGRLNLGTWQGIYLCEFRNHTSGRKIIVTLMGI